MDIILGIASKQFSLFLNLLTRLFIPKLNTESKCQTDDRNRFTAAARPSLTPLYLRSGGFQLVLRADLPDHYQHIVAAPVERHPASPSHTSSAVP